MFDLFYRARFFINAEIQIIFAADQIFDSAGDVIVQNFDKQGRFEFFQINSQTFQNFRFISFDINFYQINLF